MFKACFPWLLYRVTSLRQFFLVEKLEHWKNFVLRGEPCFTERASALQCRDVALELRPGAGFINENGALERYRYTPVAVAGHSSLVTDTPDLRPDLTNHVFMNRPNGGFRGRIYSNRGANGSLDGGARPYTTTRRLIDTSEEAETEDNVAVQQQHT
ncbi:unnamed protein product [Heligmosomoides polygyrus]|uniref:Uncharacterized protein n=1 Tax=Heligmosomoides polygyrus TaxID=6339 RepID=A0A183FDP3_HELPZ|nr:unnamed protein product [Heligmosomoides polygyrus]